MNNTSRQPSFLLPLLIICLGIGASLFMIGGKTDVTAQQAYPAPATTAPPAYPLPASPTVGRSPTATGVTTPTFTPVPATTIPTIATTPTLPPTIRPTLTVAPPPTRILPTAQQFAQVAEVTPTLTETLECAPGRLLTISGVAPPHAPLLIYFGTRVVGGGSARASGDFVLPLTPGMERAGTYEVTVRIRGTGQIVRSLTCTVPLTTPTSVPRRLR